MAPGTAAADGPALRPEAVAVGPETEHLGQRVSGQHVAAVEVTGPGGQVRAVETIAPALHTKVASDVLGRSESCGAHGLQPCHVLGVADGGGRRGP